MSDSPARAKRGKKLARRTPLETNKPAKKPKVAAPAATRFYWYPHELQAFFKAQEPTSLWYQYFYIEYFYGCRLSEPALLLDNDINVKKRVIKLKRLKKENEEGGFLVFSYPAEDRILRCVEVAKEWKKHRGVADNPFLFPSIRRRVDDDVGAERLSQLRNFHDKKGTSWQAISRFTAHRAFRQYTKLAKIPPRLCHSHVLRHTRATMLLASGRPLEEVQRLLGHSTIKKTQRYVAGAEHMKQTFDPLVIQSAVNL